LHNREPRGRLTRCAVRGTNKIYAQILQLYPRLRSPGGWSRWNPSPLALQLMRAVAHKLHSPCTSPKWQPRRLRTPCEVTCHPYTALNRTPANVQRTNTSSIVHMRLNQTEPCASNRASRQPSPPCSLFSDLTSTHLFRTPQGRLVKSDCHCAELMASSAFPILTMLLRANHGPYSMRTPLTGGIDDRSAPAPLRTRHGVSNL
jgi:hypothetical protein